ncbi:pre-mRNA-splicing factor CWC25 homolog [Branchiostoma lanceolatum]|uniref:pre-mRNA-splicing factor CWC25 homolog n=1 Tax=Branchiostoma lanceolatum TaxID=7740 RepID=UPI003455233D
MGGGDLNLKKSWHPQTLRNIERVWKAEQKHEDERRKIEQLQNELKEEKAREDMRMFAEEQGAVRKKDDRLNWMYQGQPEVNRDDYLLGKPIDKAIQEVTVGKAEDPGLADNVPGASFSQSNVNSAVDMAAKIREDPLFAIKQREQQSKKELLNNPVKMKQLQQMLKVTLDKKDKKKKKKDKKKKHKKLKRSSSSDSDEGAGSRNGRDVNGHAASKARRSRSRSMSPPAVRVKHRSRVRRSRSLSQSPQKSGIKHKASFQSFSSKERRRSRTPSPSRSRVRRRSRTPSPRSKVVSRHRNSRSRSPHSKSRRHPSRSPVRSRSPARRRSRSPVRRKSRSPVRRKSRSPVRRKSRSPVRRSPQRKRSLSRSASPPKRNGPSIRKKETAKRKLDPEELERRRREMMQDAKTRDDERWQRVQKYKEDAAKEKEEDDKFRGKERAFHGLLTHTAATVEDRIKRKVHSLQRTEASKEKFFHR